MRAASAVMNLQRKLFYYLSYLGKPPWDTGVSPPELLAFIESHLPGRALDLGCGTGTNAITLAKCGWQTVGVDFVGRAVRVARRKARLEGVQVDFRQGDVARLEGITGHFDLILDIGCFHSLTPAAKRSYIENLPGLLSPNGVFMLYGFLGDESGHGITPTDVEQLEQCLRLVARQEGVDRRQRASVWFTFQQKTSP